jgi:enediyne biosynthesis protein E4
MNASRLLVRRVLPLALLLATSLVVALHSGCGPSATAPIVPDSKPPDDEQSGPPLFEDVTKSTGVDFTYRNGEEILHLAILESLGGGGALIDFDGDGLLDLFLCGGGYYDGPDKSKPLEMKEIKGRPCKLYKNLGNFKFVDVTKEAGLDVEWFYTHGAAVADYDNDGWPDLLVTGWHELRLYHNEPVDPKDPSKGRKFVDRTKEAKLPTDLWTTSAAWADFDGDGFVDFYVCQYTDWSFANHPSCTYDTKTKDVCPPKQFNALPHHVFRNNGDGTFTDVSNEAGLRMPRKEEDYKKLTHLSPTDIENLKRTDAAKEYGKGLGVIAVDFNADGKPDVYVANDTVDKLLYVNLSEKGKIRFREIGLASGTARDDRGSANGSMGMDAADYDHCGRPSLWVTNYENELHGLYHNDCSGDKNLFSFATQRSGIAALGQSFVGFGTCFIDTENRGWEDLFISNGHAIRYPTGKAPRAQKPVLMRNVGNGKFKVMTKRGGSYADSVHVGRGLLAGDLDNDGRIDLILCHLNEPVSILRNIAGKENHWLGIELAGSDHHSVVGAKLTLEAGGQKLTRFAKGGGSYLSACDQRHVFGLGSTGAIDKLTIKWPSGQEQVFTDLKTDRYWRITEGKKEALEPRGAGAE